MSTNSNGGAPATGGTQRGVKATTGSTSASKVGAAKRDVKPAGHGHSK